MNDTLQQSRLKSWLQLVRLPNLLTVPGDPLVGFLLASAGGAAPRAASGWAGLFQGVLIDQPWARAALMVAAALLFYMRGLITNDLADFAEDKRDRPDRPLPSGAVNVRSAALAASALGLGGMVLATLCGAAGCAIGILLVLSMASYNTFVKRHPVAGPLNMGLCRSLSLLLGAAAAGWGIGMLPVVTAAAVLGLYIATTTAIAAGETTQRDLGHKRWGPPVVLLLGFPALAHSTTWMSTSLQFAAMGVTAIAAFYAVWWSLLLAGKPHPVIVQMIVGKLIAGLMLIQAGMAVMAITDKTSYAPWILIGVLLVGRLLSPALRRRFYSS
ncbi:MAG: UbiA family prenyltransferase [Planctomycetaceae bacterium]|nr:UbiA family prenyltransferase [Planctomycetaceae bacterium]